MTGESYISSPFCTYCSDINFKENIKNTPMEHTLCYKPLDIVYTWVNGTDDILVKQIEKYKTRHEMNENLMRNPDWTQPVGK